MPERGRGAERKEEERQGREKGEIETEEVKDQSKIQNINSGYQYQYPIDILDFPYSQSIRISSTGSAFFSFQKYFEVTDPISFQTPALGHIFSRLEFKVDKLEPAD